jgi:uncharacterized protein YihD (DUF1040 family)
MNFFEKFYAEAGGEEVHLQIELNEDITEAKLKLKTTSKEAEFPGYKKVVIYDSEKYEIGY